MRTGTTGRRFSTCARPIRSISPAADSRRRKEANVLGVEGAFFSELYVSHNPETPDYLDYMTLSARLRVGQLGWSEGGARVDGVLPPSAVALRSHGGAGHSLPPDAARVSYKDGVLTAAVDDDSQLTFTVDGAQPQPYTGPIRTERPRNFTFSAAATAAAAVRRWAHRPITAR